MQLEWETTLKNPIMNGLSPVIDPFEKDKFLISDGWGSTYASMKLRKLSLANGDEVCSSFIKNTTRCIHFDADAKSIAAVSDNKIFLIDRNSMKLIEKFEDKISKYCDYINSDDAGRYYMMNYRSGSLFVFDVRNGIGKRKKVGSCGGIFKIGHREMIVLKPFEGSISIFDVAKEKFIREIEYSTFHQGHISCSGALFLRLGKQHLEENTNSFIDPIDKLRIYKTIYDSEFEEFEMPSGYTRFYLHPSEEAVSFLNQNSICNFSLKTKENGRAIEFDDPFRIVKYFHESNHVLLGNYKDNYKTIRLVKLFD